MGGTAQAAAITVDSTADTIANDGDCTLRKAVANANTNPPPSTNCAAGDVGAGNVTLENSTVSGNSADDGGGDPGKGNLD